MSVAKMNTFIDIISTEPVKDAEGFATTDDTVLASIRAYKEDRRGNEIWANRAAFTTANALFRFRKIPGVVVDTTHTIICEGVRYRITSVENVRNRGMYTEVLAERVEGSKR